MSGYERTKVEIGVRSAIALDILHGPFSSLGAKGKRRRGNVVKLLAELLEKESEIGDRVYVKIEERPEDRKARTLRGAINEFKLKHPEFAEELEGLIQEKRRERNNYLVFGLNPGYKLADEDYVGVLINLGFSRQEAMAVYPHIREISKRLELASEQQKRSILISR